MKKNPLLLLALFSIVFSACSTTKGNDAKTTVGKTDFYDYAWELEYISGPRIAFEGLYPEAKPFIMFQEAGSQFNGNTGCNAYTGKYTKDSNSIQFANPIKTMRFCEGGGEETFLNTLHKINKFAIDADGKLLLLTDDITMMRFKKIAKPQQ